MTKDDANEAAFKKIAEDAMNSVYDYFFINFMKQVTPQQIDSFAYEMAKSNAAHKICRVQSNYLNYQCIAPNFFVIPNGKDNFRASLSSKEGLKEQAVEHLANGLFSLFKSIGTVP